MKFMDIPVGLSALDEAKRMMALIEQGDHCNKVFFFGILHDNGHGIKGSVSGYDFPRSALRTLMEFQQIEHLYHSGLASRPKS